MEIHIIIRIYQYISLYTLLFYYLGVEDVLAHNWSGIKITLEAL